MQIQNCHISCGVQQIYGLEVYGGEKQPHLTCLLNLLSSSTSPCMSMVLFSDADIHENGQQLADQIEEQFGKKGLVSASGINPNSDNSITTWIWAPDWKAVSEYMDERRTGSDKRRVFSKDRVTKITWNHRDEAENYNPENEDDEY